MYDEAQALDEMVRDRLVTAARQCVAGGGTANCVTCGEAIESDRRAAMPSAVRCLFCQAEQERRAYLGKCS